MEQHSKHQIYELEPDQMQRSLKTRKTQTTKDPLQGSLRKRSTQTAKVSALAELWQPKTLGSLAPPTEVQAAKAAQLQRQQEIRVGEEWSEHWKLPANRTPQAMMNFWEEVKAFDLYADHCLLYKQAPFADATSQSSACRDSWL
eukprot:s1927_g5.t1